MKEGRIYNYLLPNDKPINEGAVIEAMMARGGESSYLDAETGQVTSEQASNSQRFFKISRVLENTLREWAIKFAREMVPYENPELTPRLLDILKQKAWEKDFTEFLKSKEAKGWIHGWDQWKHDYLYEELEAWLDSLPIEIKDNPEIWDDDCPLCRMMRDGVDDYETIKHGFHEANAKQMVDGIFKDQETEKKEKK